MDWPGRDWRVGIFRKVIKLLSWHLGALLLAVLFTLSNARAETNSWNTDSSGDWAVASNWSLGRVPAAADDVVIDRGLADVTVTASSGNITVRSITSTETVTLTNATSLTITFSGNFSGPLNLQGDPLLVASGAGTVVTATGAVTLNSGRMKADGGAVLNLQTATSWTTDSINDAQNWQIALATGAGSKIHLPGLQRIVRSVRKHFSSLVITASNGGVIDFSGLTTITYDPGIGTGHGIVFDSRPNGQIKLDALKTISGRGPTAFYFSGPSFTLASLEVAENVTVDASAGTTFSLPKLISLFGSSGRIYANGSGATINFPVLASVDRLPITVTAGATVNLPILSSATSSSIKLVGNGALNTAPLTNIDNTTFDLSAGAVFARIAATVYDFRAVNYYSTIVNVTGAGSKLDLSSIIQILGGVSGTTSGFHKLSATNGGVIDLSNLRTVTHASVATQQEIQFVWNPGGTILIPNLETLEGVGAVSFAPAESNYTFAKLKKVGTVGIQTAPDQTLSFPLVTQIPVGSARLQLAAGSTVHLNGITSLEGALITLASGSTLNIPSVNSITQSRIAIAGSGNLNSGTLTNIDNTYFDLSDGAVFARISAKSLSLRTQPTVGYASSWTLGQTLIRVKGAGSKLDLSSLDTLGILWNQGWVSTAHFVEVTDGGLLDVSNAERVHISNGAVNADPSIDFYANTGTILLNSTIELKGPKGRVASTGTGGLIDLRSLCVHDDWTFSETSGGKISHHGQSFTDLAPSLVQGVRSSYQLGIGAKSTWFSVKPDGSCFRQSFPLTYVGNGADIDGLAYSPAYKTIGFALTHNTTTGAVTSSRIVQIDQRYDTYQPFGGDLTGREIRAAAFVGGSLYAIDAKSNELLKMSPALGAVTGAPVKLKNNGANFDVSNFVDLAFNQEKEVLLVDENRLFTLDIFSGELTERFKDTNPLSDGLLPKYSGLALNLQGSDYQPTLMSTFGEDQLHKLSAQLDRNTLLEEFPSTGMADGIFGDLASQSTSDGTPPGPVAISVNGNEGGASVTINWNSYNESVNGADIAKFTVYQAASSFTTTSSATAIATVPPGTHTYTVNGLTLGQTKYYAVVATDKVGNENTTVVSVAGTPADVTAPSNVTNLKAISLANGISISWTNPWANGSDTSKIKIYLNDSIVNSNLPISTTTYQFSNLQPGSPYLIKVSAVDTTGNENAGATARTTPILPNPTTSAETGVGKLLVRWSTAVPQSAIGKVRVYVQKTSFTDVSALQPRVVASGGSNSVPISGLDSNTSYYFATVFETLTGQFSTAVSSIAALANSDTAGPGISDIKWNAQTLSDGGVISGDGELSANLSDASALSLFKVSIPTDGNPLTFAGSVSGSTGKARLSFGGLPEGSYNLAISATDLYGNSSESARSIVLDYPAPAAPIFTSPAPGYLTNELEVAVSGKTSPGAAVALLVGGVEQQNLVADSAGNFNGFAKLSEGQNQLRAKASNIGGESLSGVLTIVVDPRSPEIPTALRSKALPGGEIRLTWNASQNVATAKYILYRAKLPFDAVNFADKVTETRETAFTDLPATDGTYYYRVLVESAAGARSGLSNSSSSIADRLPPRATVSLSTDGAFYEPLQIYGPGNIQVSVTANEQLENVPFLTINASGGFPIVVDLYKTGALTYVGSFRLLSSSTNGDGYLVFSARDRAGNRGTELDGLNKIVIDTVGPQVTSIVINPESPVKVPAAEQQVEVTFDLTEPLPPGAVPSMSWLLSGVGRVAQAVTGLEVALADRKGYKGTLLLPANGGQNLPETLSFAFSGSDLLGNISNVISAPNSFQVYQGSLPPAAVPATLTARALPGGKIKLAWTASTGASGYQLYRRGPNATGGTALSPLGNSIQALEAEDQTPADGIYEYALASVRTANGDRTLSAQTQPVSITSDSVSPIAPKNFAAVLQGQGVFCNWQAGSNEQVKYNLYRSAAAPGEPVLVQAATSVHGNLPTTQSIDSHPSTSEHSYAVTSVDAAGNESAPSSAVYLNFQLVPVSQIDAKRSGGTVQLNWNHPLTTATFKLEIVLSSGVVELQNSSSRSYQDTGAGKLNRTYRLTVADSGGATSIAREFTVPAINFDFLTTKVSSGSFSKLPVRIATTANTDAKGILSAELSGRSFSSPTLTIPALGANIFELVLGTNSLLESELVKLSFHLSGNDGENIIYEQSQQIPVEPEPLPITIETQNFKRNATGSYRFSIENTSQVQTEIVLADNNGAAASAELRLKVLDSDENVLTVHRFLQTTGEGVVAVGGKIILRLPPGGRFTSVWQTLLVPNGVPDAATLQLEIDKIHYNFAQPSAASITGPTRRQATTVADPEYYGELTTIAPLTSFGDQAISIKGRAKVTSSQALSPFTTLDVVLRSAELERRISVTTDALGNFEYLFKPTASERGTFKASAVYPGGAVSTSQLEFTIQSIVVSPAVAEVRTPKNYEAEFDLKVSSGVGTTATGVELKYLAEDQLLAALVPGIRVTLPAPVALTSGETKTLRVKISGDKQVDVATAVRLRLVSSTTGAKILQKVLVNLRFSEASPSIEFTPSLLETGVKRRETVTEHVKVTNSGFAPVVNATLTLLSRQSSAPAPAWASIASGSNIERLEIGESRDVELFFAPPLTLSGGFHEFLLRAEISGESPKDLPIVVAVSDSGVGALQIHVADFYTGTVNDSGQIVQGVKGARIKLQHEDLPTVEFLGLTDEFGENQFQNLPAGPYFLRVSAPQHADIAKRIVIKPGISSSEDLLLQNQFVTIEWSVKEIGLRDEYQITLDAKFETNVPAPVLVMEPTLIDLPDMKQGETFYGELALTNYGLIAVEKLTSTLPASSDGLKFEFFEDLPAKLGPKERLVIPFKVTALSDQVQSVAADSSGGGCNWGSKYCIEGLFGCINGSLGSAGSCAWFSGSSTCGGGGGQLGILPDGPPGSTSPGSWGTPESTGTCVPAFLCDPSTTQPVK